MKKFLYTLLVVILSFYFTSCEKNEYHKVTYEITFLSTPINGASNFIEIGATPSYPQKEPYVDRFKIPKIWRYEYTALQKGDKISFLVSGQLYYYFEMRVYIDDVEQSYRRVRVSSYAYYGDHVEESYGLNSKSDWDSGVIEFVYR